ncbi:MAG: glycerophosphodiester phosphodiesterase [Alphaproteobacteria bacterium]
MIGHRGAAAVAPENTLASFRAAAAMGAAMVEFDVMLTADQQAVVFHDETLDRTTNGRGRVRDTPFAALSALDAGGWFEPGFAGESVPSLRETLELLQGLGMDANIEIKSGQEAEERTAETVLAIASEQWPNHRPPLLISSFSRRCLQIAREIVPTWPRGLLVDRLPADWHEAARELGVSTLHCQHRHLSPVAVSEILRAGYSVVAWTVDEPERARTLWNWGVDAVVTNNPGLLLTSDDISAVCFPVW